MPIHRAMQLLKDRTGASLMFILAITLLLLAIGASALAAAGANAAAGENQRAYNQLNMAADSVQKTIMYSLQTSGKDEKAFLNEPLATLGGQLIRALYKNELPDELYIELENYDVSISVELTPITVAGFKMCVHDIYYDDEGGWDDVCRGDAAPEHAKFSMRIPFTVTVEDKQIGKSTKTVTVYRVTNAEIRGACDSCMEYKNYDRDSIKIVNAGKWRVDSYEKLDR